MKKHVLTLSLVLASPLLLAAPTGDVTKTRKDDQTQPVTPSLPGQPGGSELDVQGPTTDDQGTTSGAIRGKNQSLRGSANPDQGTGSIAGQGTGDFGTLDANGDGKLSRDEVGARTGMSFREMDRNGDGSVSRGEYTAGLKARPGKGGTEPAKRTEGSDRTDKDDELDRRLN
jgi:hypothetical protein